MGSTQLRGVNKRQALLSTLARTMAGAGWVAVFVVCVAASLLVQAKAGDRQARGGAGSASLDPAVGQRIQQQRIVDLTQRMIKIDSQYEKDVVVRHKEIVDFIAREIKDMGLELEVIRQNPDYPIVVGRLRGSGGRPVLGITELYNTVYIGNRKLWTVDPLGGIVKNGRIYGRGASNSKGSLAASLVAARALKESGLKIKGDLVLLYTPGEGGEEFCSALARGSSAQPHTRRLVSGRGRRRGYHANGWRPCVGQGDRARSTEPIRAPRCRTVRR